MDDVAAIQCCGSALFVSLFLCLFAYLLIDPIVALVCCGPSCVCPGGIQLFPELGNQLHSIYQVTALWAV